MDKLFAYGTLSDPSQVKQVVGHALPMRDATLHGYERIRHPRLFYASVQPSSYDRVDGKLIEGVDDEAWKVLDEYEGKHYIKQAVTVDVWGGDNVEAFIYVHTEDNTPVTTAREEDYYDVHPTEQFAWKALKIAGVALALFILVSGIVAGIDFARFGGGEVYYDAARVIKRDDRGFTLKMTHLNQSYHATISLSAYRRRYGRLYPYINQLAKVKYQVGRNGKSVKLIDVELLWPSGGENQ